MSELFNERIKAAMKARVVSEYSNRSWRDLAIQQRASDSVLRKEIEKLAFVYCGDWDEGTPHLRARDVLALLDDSSDRTTELSAEYYRSLRDVLELLKEDNKGD